MFQCLGDGVFAVQEQSFKCYNCKTFLPILANLALGQSHPWMKRNHERLLALHRI